VAFVRWCAARSYCQWAGKHLCGARGGGALDVTLVGQSMIDMWTAACSQEGLTSYPYATAYVPTACNGDQNGVRASIPVGTLATCAIPDSGVRDLSGNVWEWIDACDATGFCFAHGGAFNSPAGELTCTSALRVTRDGGLDTVGFRCCSDGR
jgi:formylglycine-generating enzyme required for sulfatase activity